MSSAFNNTENKEKSQWPIKNQKLRENKTVGETPPQCPRWWNIQDRDTILIKCLSLPEAIRLNKTVSTFEC